VYYIGGLRRSRRAAAADIFLAPSISLVGATTMMTVIIGAPPMADNMFVF